MHSHICDNCGEAFEGPYEKMKLCGDCAEEKAMSALAKVEPPEGGWRRGSDMDRL